MSLSKSFIATERFSKSSRLRQRQVKRRHIPKEVRRLVCALNFLHDPDTNFLGAMKDDALTTARRGKGTLVRENVLVYLESRCGKFWRRTNWFRPSYSHVVEYGGFEVGDANFIDMIKISLPPADVAGCVYLKHVRPENMNAQYTNPENGSTLRTPSEAELTVTKRCLLFKPGSYPAVLAGLLERKIIELTDK